MARLIDADKLIEYLNDYALQEAPFRGESESTDAYDAIEQCIEAVKEQPTVYDVDKVAEKLSCKECGECELVDVCNGSMDDGFMERICEIIKAGGKNDA